MSKEIRWSITDIRRKVQQILEGAHDRSIISFKIRSLSSENDKIIIDGEYEYSYFLKEDKHFKIVLKASDLSLISITT